MPTPPYDIQMRLSNIMTCLTVTGDTLRILAASLKGPFLEMLSVTTQSLLKNIETVKQNKNNCVVLMEQTYELLNAIIILHIKSETGGELPPITLKHIGNFTETLHKIHTFVEAQQSGSKIKMFFRQGQMSTLLKDCKNGLKQGIEVFQIKTVDIMGDIAEIQQQAKTRHQEVLAMIDALSDAAGSDGASTMSWIYSGHNRSPP
ncbi:hypothetical protein MVEN_00690400 [Mycena venus]|uniref:Uncharacterized protein n=1 Tax=Mycena venus TaxID=2733690 RepID=A0A8H6YH57_9AGAR|nr:hypothetical protein MVEN_00690400 [Mycena venus]